MVGKTQRGRRSFGSIQLPEALSFSVPGPFSPRNRPENRLFGKLWEEAYGELQKTDPKLVQAYNKILSHQLKADVHDNQDLIVKAWDNEDILSSLKGEAFLSQMKRLVDKGLQRTEALARRKHVAHEVVERISQIKEVVDTAVKAVPQAAIAWAGLCFSLQVLANPLKQSSANRDGVLYVANRLQRYSNLPDELASHPRASWRAAKLQAGSDELVVRLLTALLSYQMKSVCSYYRNQVVELLRDIVKLDDWEASLKEITDAERDLVADVKIDIGLRTLDTVEDFHDSFQTGLEEASLRNLFIIHPASQIAELENRDPLIEGTWEWVLSTDQVKGLRQWGGPSPRVICVSGQAGAGKTMLLAALARELEKSWTSEQTPMVCHFFVTKTNDNLNSPTSALRGLLWMLFQQQPWLRHHYRSQFGAAGPTIFQDSGAVLYPLVAVLNAAIADPRFTDTYFVVDALDELTQQNGEPGWKVFLRTVESTLETSQKIKWVLSTQSGLGIEASLMSFGDPRLLDLDSKPTQARVSAAVRTYIEHKLGTLNETKGYGLPLLDDMVQKLYEKASGNFLLASLACRELEGISTDDAGAALDHMPPEITEFYNRSLHQADNLAERDLEPIRGVLATMAVVYEPLQLSELEILTTLPPRIGLSYVVGVWSKFLSIEGQHIKWRSNFAKDHVLRHGGMTIFPSGFNKIHSMVVSRLIHSMSVRLKRDICNVGEPGRSIDQISVSKSHTLLQVRYACLHWVEHLRDIKDIDCHRSYLVDGGIVDGFLRDHLLHWLEALSLLRRLPDGLQQLKTLKNISSRLPGTESVSSLVVDAIDFIRYHQYIIQQCPLQLYASALVFSPSQSLVLRNFERERFLWIGACSNLENDWSSFFRMHNRHTRDVRSIAYSPDGSFLASASNDSTIRLWSPVSGANLGVLQGHTGEVNSVVVSANSQIIASASADKTARIWDVGTKTTLAILADHGSSVNSVSLSNCGRFIATACGDGAVKVWEWDRKTSYRRQIRCFHDSSEPANYVAFSHDSRWIAAGLADFSVRVWDLQTENEELLYYHGPERGYVNCVSFSPDSRYISSASADGTIQIWDTQTKQQLQCLRGCGGPINTAFFSSDSRWILSACTDRDTALLIWDWREGKVHKTLEQHRHIITCAVFSPNSDRVASCCGWSSIMIRDAISGDLQLQVQASLDPVRAVAFSRNPVDPYFTTGGADNKVRLWSRKDGSHIRDMEGHDLCVNCVCFSHDQRWIASGSEDKTVRIWDLHDECRLEIILDAHQSSVNAVVFSPDSRWLASASADGVVRIWSLPIQAACPQMEFRAHKGPVNSVAFSDDSAWLASASTDGDVYKWEVATFEQDASPRRVGATQESYVSSVTFLPKSKQIVTATVDGVVRVFDEQDDKPVTEMRLGTSIGNKPFRAIDSASGAQYLATELGSVDLAGLDHSGSRVAAGAVSRVKDFSSTYPKAAWAGYGISVNRSWITYDGENVLWLPPEYRPSRSAVDVQIPFSVVLGCGSGKVLAIQFSEWMRPFFRSQLT